MKGWRYQKKAWVGTSTSFGGRGASVTSGGLPQEWVSIVRTWGSRFEDRSQRQGQKLGDRKTDGDAVGRLGDGDGAD
jgi:hypothetical protein